MAVIMMWSNFYIKSLVKNAGRIIIRVENADRTTYMRGPLVTILRVGLKINMYKLYDRLDSQRNVDSPSLFWDN